MNVNRPLVLVAIDHATDMKRAIDVARGVAKERGADLDVIQVLPHGAVFFDDRPMGWPVESRHESTSLGRKLASILRSGEDDGVDVRRVTLRGAPEHVIPAYSQLHQATLLVVQRDYGSSRFWRHGRVVEDLARRSPMPLLVLPKRPRSEPHNHGLRRILAPVDFSIASAVALRTVEDLSRRQGAQVTVVHALKDMPRELVFSGGEALELARQLPAQLDATANRLRRTAAALGVHNVDTEVVTGEAVDVIRELAARRDPDLVVMGIAHRSWLGRVVFGSVLRRVLRRATVPVLVVPVVAGRAAWPEDRRDDQVHRGVWAESRAERVAA